MAEHYAYDDCPTYGLQDFEDCKVIFMRHAQSEQNRLASEAEEKYGRSSPEFAAFQREMSADLGLIDAPLSEEGRKQAASK
jgi:broad specificity phosphatase PhoE